VEIVLNTIYDPTCAGCRSHTGVLPLIVFSISHACSILAINSAERRGAVHPVMHELYNEIISDGTTTLK
jgi:hypothetical protein